MHKIISSFIQLGLFSTFLITPSFIGFDTAHGKLKICNETGKDRDLAIGYKAKDGWTSEGWWKLADGECVIPIKDDLETRFFYYRAKHKGEDFDGERYMFCTEGKAFTIAGDEDCVKRGYRAEDFRKLELMKGTTGFTFTLDESNIYSEETIASKQAEKKGAELKQAAGPDAPAGTHGESYSIVGTYKGCDPIDGLEICVFATSEWDYKVINDGKSNTQTFDRLWDLTMNRRYVIKGDILAYGDTGIDVTIRNFEEQAETQEEALYRPLIGLWRSTTDPTYKVRFDDDFFKIDYSEGNVAGSYTVAFTQNCMDPQVRPSDSLLLQTTGLDSSDDFSCYDLIEANQNKLVLMYLPRGNFLEFVREE